MESEYFRDVVRAQLTTSSSKPCTFFGFDSDGKRIFGKGPYPSKYQAEIGVKVANIKSLLSPGIKQASIELVELIPDGMEDCQFGYRKTCDISKPHWFQVVRDVMPNEKEWPPTSMKKSSARAWSTPVDVVDWSLIKNYSHVEYNKKYAKSIYKTNPAASVQFVTNIILSWVLGAGADLAFSNFILDHSDNSVVQVDNEVIFNNEWWLTDTRVCSKRSKAYDQFSKFVSSISGELFSRLLEMYNTNKDKIIEMVEQKNANIIYCKLMALNEDWGNASTLWIKKHRELEGLSVTPVPSPKESTPKLPVSPKSSLKRKGSEDDLNPRQFKMPTIIERENKLFTVKEGIYIGESSPLYNHAKDPWGHSISVRKSDFQKAIRRGDFRQAVVSFFVCYNLARIYPANTSAKIIRTNILNRLCVCVFEDIGVANVPLVNYVCSSIENVVNGLKENESKNFDSLLGSLIFQMCISKKTRLQSHISHAYNEKNAYIAINRYELKWNNDPKSDVDPNYIRVLEKDHRLAWKYYRRAFPEYIYTTWQRFNAKNRIAVIRYVFLVSHLMNTNYVHFPDIKSSFLKLYPIPKQYVMEKYYQNKIKLDPKPYAYDMHVKGTRTEEDIKQFRNQGCYITNEDQRFNIKTYRDIYEISSA